ncbi:MAG: phage tail protein I [Pseudomonadales bacterium]|nr:phage tail protein I [Pseudomonadales bacterium]
MDTLLPPNSAPLEIALDQVISPSGQLPGNINHLWSAALCPVPFLPWLAWSVSVDTWNTDWSETKKRQVIASSAAVHALKGTRAAVELGLGALSLATEITEWHQEMPLAEPGTFRVDVFSEVDPVDEALIFDVDSIVVSTKNVRSHHTIRVNLLSRAAPIAAAGMKMANVITVQPAV